MTRSWPGWLARMAFVALAIQFSANVARPLVTYRVLQLDGGSFEVGVIAASFSLLPVAIALPAGRWLDRRREPPVVRFGAALFVVGVVPMVWSVNLWSLAIGCAVTGLGQVLAMMGLQTHIANNSPPARQDARYGLFTIFTSLGQIIGPIVGTAVAAGVPGGSGQLSTAPGFVIAGLLAVAAALSTVGMRTADPRQRLAGAAKTRVGQGAGIRRVLTRRGVSAYIYVGMALFIAVDLIAVFLPAYAEENGVDARMVGLLLGVRAGCTMLSRLCLPLLVRAVGRTVLVRLSVLVAGVVLTAVPWLHTPVLLVAAMALAGFPLGVGQPLTMSEIAQRTSAELRGTAMGLRMVANRVGQVAIPALVGLVAAGVGVGAAFWMMGGLLVSAGVLPGLGRIDSRNRRR